MALLQLIPLCLSLFAISTLAASNHTVYSAGNIPPKVGLIYPTTNDILSSELHPNTKCIFADLLFFDTLLLDTSFEIGIAESSPGFYGVYRYVNITLMAPRERTYPT